MFNMFNLKIYCRVIRLNSGIEKCGSNPHGRTNLRRLPLFKFFGRDTFFFLKVSLVFGDVFI